MSDLTVWRCYVKDILLEKKVYLLKEIFICSFKCQKNNVYEEEISSGKIIGIYRIATMLLLSICGRCIEIVDHVSNL